MLIAALFAALLTNAACGYSTPGTELEPITAAGSLQRHLSQHIQRERGRRARPRLRRKLQFDAFIQQARSEIPFSEEASGCSPRVGIGYLERWRKLGGTYCSTNATRPGGAAPDERPRRAAGGGDRFPPPPPPAFGSSVRCNVHPAVDLTACLATNMVLDGAEFAGRDKAADELPRAAPGSVRLGCNETQPVGAFLRGRLRNEGPRRWLVDAARLEAPEAVEEQCSSRRAVRHAVVFLMRLDGSNAFHNAETIVHLFLGLAALQLPPDVLQGGLQVIIADDKPSGFFLEILRRLSLPHPLVSLRASPPPRGTCFRAAVLAPFVGHGNSLLATAAEEVGCRSVMIHAASLWLRHLFRDLTPRAAAAGPADDAWQQLGGVRTLQLVWLSRAHFEASMRGKMTKWQEQRVAPNEPEVAAALQRAVMRWNNGSCALHQTKGCRAAKVSFAFQVLELSELPFLDQVFVLSRTGVLAGVHGAGLTNMMLMTPGQGAVLEVWHGMEDNWHYANLATALGHHYANIKSEGSLPAEDIAAAAVKAMDVAAARHAEPQRQKQRGTAGLLGQWWNVGRAWAG